MHKILLNVKFFIELHELYSVQHFFFGELLFSFSEIFTYPFLLLFFFVENTFFLVAFSIPPPRADEYNPYYFSFQPFDECVEFK